MTISSSCGDTKGVPRASGTSSRFRQLHRPRDPSRSSASEPQRRCYRAPHWSRGCCWSCPTRAAPSPALGPRRHFPGDRHRDPTLGLHRSKPALKYGVHASATREKCSPRRFASRARQETSLRPDAARDRRSTRRTAPDRSANSAQRLRQGEAHRRRAARPRVPRATRGRGSPRPPHPLDASLCAPRREAPRTHRIPPSMTSSRKASSA